MKLITANKLNRLWKNGVLPALSKKMDTIRVLKTTEEVTASTNEENVPSAIVVGEVINNLKGFEPILDSTGKITGYKTSVGGADTVFPFFDATFTTLESGKNPTSATDLDRTFSITKEGLLVIAVYHMGFKAPIITKNGAEISHTTTYGGLYIFTTKANVGDSVKVYSQAYSGENNRGAWFIAGVVA